MMESVGGRVSCGTGFLYTGSMCAAYSSVLAIVSTEAVRFSTWEEAEVNNPGSGCLLIQG